MNGEISLKLKDIDPDLSSYYVQMSEGALFNLCETRGDLRLVCTSGLCGCVAIAIYIRHKIDNASYVFLNHTESDLSIAKIPSTISMIEQTLRDGLGCFDFSNDTDYETLVFVVANGFGKSAKLATALYDQLKGRLSKESMCKYSQSNAVGFMIDIPNRVVRLIKPKYDLGNTLTYYGKRHDGYGRPVDKNDEPYKNTCGYPLVLE